MNGASHRARARSDALSVMTKITTQNELPSEKHHHSELGLSVEDLLPSLLLLHQASPCSQRTDPRILLTACRSAGMQIRRPQAPR